MSSDFVKVVITRLQYLNITKTTNIRKSGKNYESYLPWWQSSMKHKKKSDIQ